ncbi:MAG: DoxX family membrane protein [Saprospiraceae bacterium]|nr:DoxX family membrane protein [Saprospiraceae bacterium]
MVQSLRNYVFDNSTRLLRWAIGINYFWFGMLKFFSGLSPAEALAKDTIRIITFGFIPDDINLLLLSVWEVAIGVIFLSGYFIRLGASIAIVHMIFTFLPLFFFPEVSFSHAPYGFTIVGQYIVKNLVFLAALCIILKEERTGLKA